jgi:hypothetical protein
MLLACYQTSGEAGVAFGGAKDELKTTFWTMLIGNDI